MKRMLQRLGSLGFATLLAGCAASLELSETPEIGPTYADAKRSFPMNDLSRQRIRLSAEESQWINGLYGDLIARPGDPLVYYEARKWRSLRKKGYLFRIKEQDGAEVLVGVVRGRVSDLSPVEASRERTSYRQLLGCSLEDCFGFVRDDAGFLQRPPKAEADMTPSTASRTMADAVKKALIFAEVLRWSEWERAR